MSCQGIVIVFISLQNIVEARTFVQEGCLRCDPKKSENEKEKERERRQEAVHYKVSTVGNESFILPGLRFVQNTM